MAKTSGGTRSQLREGRSNSPEMTKRETAEKLFSSIETNYGRAVDFSRTDREYLKKLIKKAKQYNPQEKEKAISNYVTYYTRREDSSESELIRVANLASLHRNLPLMQAELKRRKGK